MPFLWFLGVFTPAGTSVVATAITVHECGAGVGLFERDALDVKVTIACVADGKRFSGAIT